MGTWKKVTIYVLLISLSLGSFTTKGTLTDIIYVDDDGEADYTRIQDAIAAAEPGDTIFVYDGIYHENIMIDKNVLTLQGQSEGGTIIDGEEKSNVITVSYTSSVHISTFTIRNGGVHKGIHLSNANSGSITQCTVYGNYIGIMFDCSDYNVVRECTFRDSDVFGAQTYGCSPKNNTIYRNNFMENNMANAYDNFVNEWDDGSEGNYWDDYRGSDADGDGIGDTPYNISGGNNKDTCPLMEPLDDAPPITTHIFSGNIGQEGWYISNVEVTLHATDPGTGIQETKYKIGDGNWKVYTSPFNLDTDGIHKIYYYSMDKNGNEENIHSYTVKVDKTSPVVTIRKPQSRLYLFDREIIPTASPILIGKITIEADITDAFSGVKEAKLFVNPISGEDDLKETFDDGPYEWLWDETAFGKYKIKMTAVDKANTTHAAEVEITVRKLF